MGIAQRTRRTQRRGGKTGIKRKIMIKIERGQSGKISAQVVDFPLNVGRIGEIADGMGTGSINNL